MIMEVSDTELKKPPVKLTLSRQEYLNCVYGDDLGKPGHKKLRDALFDAQGGELIITIPIEE
jgi:hypothetical protein